VKWSTVIDAKTVRPQVRRAMRTATADTARPGAFRIPAERDQRARPANIVAESPLTPNWITPGPDRADLKPALDMIGRAKRPILIAGMVRLLVQRVRRIREVCRAISARRC